MSIKHSNQQAIIYGLDSMYMELVERAKQLARSFFEQASTLEPGIRRHEADDSGATAHRPVLGYLLGKNIGAPGKPAIPRVINKGKGDKYPVGTFSSVKEPLKGLCRNYEKRLAPLRAACLQNRTLRRSIVAHGRLVERTIHAAAGW